MLIHV